jgi:nucleotide-binding universal stress UspA family protein
MNRILVAVDFSEETDEVISEAVTLTKALQGRLRILHVNDSAPYSYTPKKDIPIEPKPQSANAPLETGHLGAIRARLLKEQLEADYRLMEGPAADNIVSAAREFAADIIVIGAHEHGKFFRCFFGDTTESLIRHAPCPILVVPHEGGKQQE